MAYLIPFIVAALIIATRTVWRERYEKSMWNPANRFKEMFGINRDKKDREE